MATRREGRATPRPIPVVRSVNPPVPQGSSSKPHLFETARKAILNSDSRAEQAHDDTSTPLRKLQEQWADFERWFSQADVRMTDVRAQFSRIIADGVVDSSSRLASSPPQTPRLTSHRCSSTAFGLILPPPRPACR